MRKTTKKRASVKKTRKRTAPPKSPKRPAKLSARKVATATNRKPKRAPRRPTEKKTVNKAVKKRAPEKKLAESATTTKKATKKTPPKRHGVRSVKILKVKVPKATPKRIPKPPPEVERPALPKTYLRKRELETFRQLLLAKRGTLLGDVTNMTDEALSKNRQSASGDLSNMPIHMADLGSDNFEQEFTLGLIASERALLREINEALQRIEDRTYGMCLATGKPITRARLRAQPWAKYCIEYARRLERGF